MSTEPDPPPAPLPDPPKPPRLRRARITEEQFNEMVAFYRKLPGATKQCARVTGRDEETARRAWHEGWAAPEWAVVPIKRILHEEQNAARGLFRAQAEATGAAISAHRLREKELARLDAAAERAREAQAIRANMSSSLTQLAVLGTLSKVAVPLAQRVVELTNQALEQKAVDVKSAMAFLRQLSSLTQETGAGLKATMDMVAQHLGPPEEHLGGRDNDPSRKSDAALAVQHLGEDVVHSAVKAILDGTVSEDAERLIRWQDEQDGMRH